MQSHVQSAQAATDTKTLELKNKKSITSGVIENYRKNVDSFNKSMDLIYNSAEAFHNKMLAQIQENSLGLTSMTRNNAVGELNESIIAESFAKLDNLDVMKNQLNKFMQSSKNFLNSEQYQELPPELKQYALLMQAAADANAKAADPNASAEDRAAAAVARENLSNYENLNKDYLTKLKKDGDGRLELIQTTVGSANAAAYSFATKASDLAKEMSNIGDRLIANLGKASNYKSEMASAKSSQAMTSLEQAELNLDFRSV